MALLHTRKKHANAQMHPPTSDRIRWSSLASASAVNLAAFSASRASDTAAASLPRRGVEGRVGLGTVAAGHGGSVSASG